MNRSTVVSKWAPIMQAALHITPVPSLLSVDSAHLDVCVADSLIKHPATGNGIFASKTFRKGEVLGTCQAGVSFSLRTPSENELLRRGWNIEHHCSIIYYVLGFRSSSGNGNHPMEQFLQEKAAVHRPNGICHCEYVEYSTYSDSSMTTAIAKKTKKRLTLVSV